MQQDKEAVKLDEILKSLISTSKQVLVNFINTIFQEEFSDRDVDITIGNNEFSLENSHYDIVRGDLFLQLTGEKQKAANYHIEFQTKIEIKRGIAK